MKMSHETITGVVSNLKVIPTRSAMNMVTFTLGERSCKAFGEVAAAVQSFGDEKVEIIATRGVYRGQPEYAVVSAKAVVEGREVSVRAVRTVSPRVETPRKPLEAGMIEWHTRPGERDRFRVKVAAYGDAALLDLFDKLPHPVCSKERFSEMARVMNKHDEAVLEEFFRRNGLNESERLDFIGNFGQRVVDKSSLEYWWELRASNRKSHPDLSSKVAKTEWSR
jgi:hypothetical protein